MPNTKILVVGYPRSGNTWLARLLGECLDSPVKRWGDAVPIAEEGLDRHGEYTIHQLHLRPTFNYDYCGVKQAIISPQLFNTWAWKEEKIVHIMRDPRDVCVSVKFYWGMRSIANAIVAVGEGKKPVEPHGAWSDFVNSWHMVSSSIRYCDLHDNTIFALKRVLSDLEVDVPDNTVIERVVSNQSFEEKRNQIMREQVDVRPYGREIQLKALRKGMAGDWMNYFDDYHAELAQYYFGQEMLKFGFVSSVNWWNNRNTE